MHLSWACRRPVLRASPSGAGCFVGRLGIARIRGISVVRLTAAANRPGRRAPARPSARARDRLQHAVTAWVRPACRQVRPLTCSANAFFGHAGARQRNRRNCRKMTTSQRPADVSGSRCSCRP